MIRNFFLSLFVRKPKHTCTKCSNRNTEYGHYGRGWNYLCDQCYGDYGYYCHRCGKIDFVSDIHEHLKTLPEWCKPIEKPDDYENYKHYIADKRVWY